jgi:hypothetical protein
MTRYYYAAISDDDDDRGTIWAACRSVNQGRGETSKLIAKDFETLAAIHAKGAALEFKLGHKEESEKHWRAVYMLREASDIVSLEKGRALSLKQMTDYYYFAQWPGNEYKVLNFAWENRKGKLFWDKRKRAESATKFERIRYDLAQLMKMHTARASKAREERHLEEAARHNYAVRVYARAMDIVEGRSQYTPTQEPKIPD